MTLAEQIFEILESRQSNKNSMESMECMHFPKTVAAICCCSANLPQWLAIGISAAFLSISAAEIQPFVLEDLFVWIFYYPPIWQWQKKGEGYTSKLGYFPSKTLEQSWWMILMVLVAVARCRNYPNYVLRPGIPTWNGWDSDASLSWRDLIQVRTIPGMSPQWFGPWAAPMQLQRLDDLQGVFSYKC